MNQGNRGKALKERALQSMEAAERSRVPEATEVESVDDCIAAGGSITRCPPGIARGFRPMTSKMAPVSVCTGGDTGSRASSKATS